MLKNKKIVENTIRSAKTFTELKEALLELLEISAEEVEFELLSERVSNLENLKL